jgi:hypothetical protein
VNATRLPSGLNDGETLSVPRPTVTRCAAPPCAGIVHKSVPSSAPLEKMIVDPSGEYEGVMLSPPRETSVRFDPLATSITPMREPVFDSSE